MEHLRIACCYFPTTVIFVDDNRKFHNNIKLSMDRKTAVYKFYNNPNEALQFLTGLPKYASFLDKCLSRPEERHRDHRSIDVNVGVIHLEIYNPGRFDQVSVLVVDYAMPGMNGLEISRQLKNSPIKIILLTGEASEKLALEAFNKGEIHRFIRKDDANFNQILNEAISDLQNEFFKDQSEVIISSLTKNPGHPSCCLDDPVFIEFFDKFCKKYQFTEYFLSEATGSFLFLDANGKPSWLIVKDEDEMEGAVSEAELSDAEVPPDVLVALKSKEKLLHRYSHADYFKLPVEWMSLMHPAKKLEGRNTYYYAYIDDPKAYPIDSSRVLSYAAYLEKL